MIIGKFLKGGKMGWERSEINRREISSTVVASGKIFA